jgi:tetratricopeptide (TPR) repeat protein
MDSSDMGPELHTIWSEAKEYIEQGDYDKAIGIYNYVLIRYGDNDIAVEYANAYLGDIYLTLRRLGLAEKHIKKAIDCSPDNPGYHYLLGFTYSIQHQWGKAIAEFEMAVARESNNSEYLRGLGWAIHCAGDKAKGLAYLHKAIDLAPTNVNILTDLAVAYLSALQFKKARDYAEAAMRSDPSNIMAQDVLKNVLSFDKGFRQRSKRAGKASTTIPAYFNTNIIHRFKVSLRDRPDIWRVIEMKENQMLSSLHKAIFNAFDRFDEHQYSFFMSNKPYDKENEYTSPGIDTRGKRKLATRIRIDSLALHPGQKFLYLFDYGDEWWHEVELIGVSEEVPRGNYPRVTKRHGKSPPQYSSKSD